MNMSARQQRGKNLLPKIVLAGFATALAFGALELALRRVSPSRVTGIGTARTEAARFYGWALPPGERLAFVDPDTGRASFFPINSKGWRDVEHSYLKPGGCVRILCLGDSVTYGAVPFKDLYTRRVEELLHREGYTNVEVVSMGVGGWGTDQGLEALEREGVRYRPDIVIYQFCGNDITDNLQPTATTPTDDVFRKKPFRYEIRDGQLFKRRRYVPPPRPLPGIVRMKTFLLSSAVLWNLNRLRHTLFPEDSSPEGGNDPSASTVTNAQGDVYLAPPPRTELEGGLAKFQPDPTSPMFPFGFEREPEQRQQAWVLFSRLVGEMKRVAAENGARFLVFSEESDDGKRLWHLGWKKFQTDDQGDFIIKDGERYAIDWKRPLKSLRRACEALGIPLIEPKRTYERYKYDPHPNVKGNAAMAADIVDFIVENGIIDNLATQGNEAAVRP